jgi:hypothetical protein
MGKNEIFLRARPENRKRSCLTMARDQKIKSKASQGHNVSTKQRAARAALDPDTTQPTVDTKSPILDETQGANNEMTTDTTHPFDATISTQQEQGRASQPSPIQQAVWTGLQPSWPSWPTSKPGPRSTPPALGMRSINRLRPEQFREVAYNQETGEPATQSPFRSLPDERTTGPTSFDQPTAQDVLGKRKQRL